MIWVKQERGWYTSDIGGISLEGSGRWFFWPMQGPRKGPFKTLALAKASAATPEQGGPQT